MQNLFHYIHNHTHYYKTEKSIYNIIIGKKSHQTFFDACSQQLLSLYHSLPNLKYPSFERYYASSGTDNESQFTLITHPRFTFDSLINTFQALQLLTQTISQLNNNNNSHFIPVTQQQVIHQRVKSIYKHIKSEQQEQTFIDELYNVFEKIKVLNNETYIHYYLQGFEDSMYTRQQVSLIEGLSQETLFELEINDLVALMYEIENEQNYPILNQLIILPSLLQKTDLTYDGLKKGYTMQALANQQQVKINTIEDHVLELFIKGYITDYQTFLNDNLNSTFLTYYMSNRSERLRNYKEKFPELSYFTIKLIIAGIERGDIHVNR